MLENLLARHVRPQVLEALAESRAVALLGARQVGKSTLVTDIAANEHPPGALIYTGADTLPFGDRLAAVPLSGLWH